MAAAQELIARLPCLPGGVITFDALHAVRQTMGHVVGNQHGDFLIQVKDNTPALVQAVEAALARTQTVFSCGPVVSCGHGRIETRTLEMAPLSPVATGWPHTHTACRVTRERELRRRGQTVSRAEETARYVASFAVTTHPPEHVLKLIRGHWSIENVLHHRKDRSLDEDRNRAAANGIGRVMCARRSIVAAVLGRAAEPLSVLQQRFAAKPRLLLKLLFSRSLSQWERTWRPYRLRAAGATS